MSWFSDLTSKAEAMLVRLDQDAAQALQKPENILTRTRLLDKALSSLDANQDEMNPMIETHNHDQEDHVLVTDIEDDQLSTEGGATSTSSHSHEHSFGPVMAPASAKAVESSSHSNGTPDASRNVQNVRQHPGYTSPDQNQNVHAIKETPSPPPKSETPQQARKFKLQTSKLRQPLLDRQMSPKAKTKPNFENLNDHGSSKIHNSLVSPEADDIRASINKSLQEYSLTTSPFSRRSPHEQTTFSSHFDDQPNLIRSIDKESDSSRLNDRLQSSPSFSINFPDNGGSSTDITDQILIQSALKRKSNFNLHKVLNKLAGNSVQSQAIIGDKTKIRLRRAQMRVASYMRRLNYNFRAYPTMKYWAIGYLVLLQLLVVYVLFFYKSTGSSSYLAAQVRQQQEEFNEVNYQSNVRKIIPPSDLHSNSL